MRRAEDQSITSTDVMVTLDFLTAERSVPTFIHSDKGPEFIAEVIQNHVFTPDIET